MFDPIRSLLWALVLSTCLGGPSVLAADPPAETQASPAPPTGRLIGTRPFSHPDWFKQSFLDIEEDIQEAAQAGKQLILFFEMNGCPYCARLIEENFAQEPSQSFIRERFDVIALNVDGDREVTVDADQSLPEKEFAQRIGVRYTPTLLFLNHEGEPVARVDGYRSPADFKLVLDYVASRAYERQTLAEFISASTQEVYRLRPHPRFQDLRDLAGVKDRPLALLFEDARCLACNALHDGHLADPEVDAALAPFVVVRLDALADTQIIAPDGRQTTARALAEALGIDYRPTWVLFDQGREIARIENELSRYHFIGILEYVGQRQYQRYPDSPFDYINAKTAERLARGEDVRIID